MGIPIVPSVIPAGKTKASMMKQKGKRTPYT